MHREISHADQQFRPASGAFLYLFTALVGLLLAADLLFPTAAWAAFAAGIALIGLNLARGTSAVRNAWLD